MGLKPLSIMGLWQTEKQLFNGLHGDLLAPEHGTEAAVLKAPILYVKQAHLKILKLWTEG